MQAPGATDGYGRVVGSQGHSCVTTASGFPGLTVIQCTNNTRLDHASQSLPQNPKKEKRRGKAIRPPGLGRRERVPSIDDCINVASGGVEVISIDVLVYLPLPPTGEINFYHLPRQLIFYEINKEAYRMVLNALGLFHQYPNLPTSTTIFNLFSDITVKLRQQYNLPSVSSSLPLAPQELLPLQLLGFSNHGRANGSYNTSKLRPMPYERYTTIQDILTSNFGTYVIPKLVITRDNHFTLHAITHLRPIMFRNASDANLNVNALDEEEIEGSCEPDDDDDDEEASDSRVVAQSLTASLETDDEEPQPSSGLEQNSNVSQSPSMLVSTSSIVDPVLPKKLWEEPWTQPAPLSFIPIFFDDERTPTIFKIVSEVQSQGSNCPGFQVKGTDEQELAAKFIAQMKNSVQSGDWSKVLSPTRHFVCVNDQDDYISSGPGLKQSAIAEVFRQFFEERESEFCTPLYEGYTTLQAANVQISSSKHEELVLFGAVTSLALVYGHYPGHVKPMPRASIPPLGIPKIYLLL
ncbi:MAG: hypothetical protein NXY57DRAFT_966362 [Lentinula lateritia]|nr:MAG: hypothetical protein NXY57DRAFT_966362 [Lentinula lateritia]